MLAQAQHIQGRTDYLDVALSEIVLRLRGALQGSENEVGISSLYRCLVQFLQGANEFLIQGHEARTVYVFRAAQTSAAEFLLNRGRKRPEITSVRSW